MRILKAIQTGTSYSFEFSPPKDQTGAELLFSSIADLMPLKPSWVSVTYGAGGSTRNLTRDLVLRLKRETDLEVVAHLTCVGSTRREIEAILENYASNGIGDIMALRGDAQQGSEKFIAVKDGFSYAADLVAFIKQHFPAMSIGVAGYPEGHPETPNRLKEIDFLKKKIDAGADYICTQLFFDNHDFFDFLERCRLAGITVPIIAGIMPVTSRKTMLRMAETALGSRYPAPLLKYLSSTASNGQIEKAGIHWATEQVRDLIHKGAQGIHFYTLNRSRATLRIYDSLGISSLGVSA